MIRLATTSDIPRLIQLLHQVNMVHHNLHPEIFKANTTKYDENQLNTLINRTDRVIFVYEEETVLGYIFGEVEEIKDSIFFHNKRTLYIDDICVDEQERGRHIGRQLFEFTVDYAKKAGFDFITLNVWEGNDRAMKFYKSMGMTTRKTCMELTL